MRQCLLFLKLLLIVFDIFLLILSFMSTKSKDKEVSKMSQLIGTIFALNAIAIFFSY